MLALLFLAMTGQVYSTCSLYKCSDSISTGTCAKVTATYEISVNSNGCPSTSPYCNLDDVESWAEYAYVGDTFSCSSTNDTTYWTVPSDVNYLVCGSRLSYKNLASGSHPKICSDNRDCQLEDATYGECKCGLNGQMYCMPDLNSDPFDEYWNQCCDIGCGTLDTFKHYLFWYLKYNYYVEYISGYSCTKIFSQLSDIDNLDYVGSGAKEVLLGLAGLYLL